MPNGGSAGKQEEKREGPAWLSGWLLKQPSLEYQP